jgi:thiol-disulfide isomerase/thioredoxin
MKRLNQTKALLALAVLTATGFGSGCDSKTAAPIAIPTDNSADSYTDSSPSGDRHSQLVSRVALVDGSNQTLADWIAKHHGKVVLVDFWATWCGPCVKEFPHLVELSNRHRDAGLAVISVSMNEPKDRPSVLAFLERQKADFENLLPEYGAGSKFLEAFDLRGDVPFYKLYDSKGVLRFSFSDDPSGIENCESIEKIDSRVEALLKEISQ